MIRTQHAWFSVKPWAQLFRPFTGTDPWTVLPFSGLRDTPDALVREIWRPPFERRVITPHPYSTAILLEPDEPEAIAIFAATLGAEVLAAEDAASGGAVVFAPVLRDLFLIGQHLASMHGQPTERLALHIKTLGDRQLYHAGLHQQVAMYPLPRPHWHR